MNMLLSRLLPASAAIMVAGATILVASPTSHIAPVVIGPEAAHENLPSPAPVAARRAGMRVHLDENGKPFVPSTVPPDVVVAPSGARAMTGEEPPLTELDAPGGGKLVILGDRFLTYSVARRGPDGTPAVTCVGSAAAIDREPHPGGHRGGAPSESGAGQQPIAPPAPVTVQLGPPSPAAIDTRDSR